MIDCVAVYSAVGYLTIVRLGVFKYLYVRKVCEVS